MRSKLLPFFKWKVCVTHFQMEVYQNDFDERQIIYLNDYPH